MKEIEKNLARRSKVKTIIEQYYGRQKIAIDVAL